VTGKERGRVRQVSGREGGRQVSEAAGKERGIRERATQTSTTDAEGSVEEMWECG